MYAVDFFCGAGGLTRGLLNAGVKVIFGIDYDKDCQKTYESNNRPAKFLHADLRTLDPGDLLPYIGNIPSEKMLFAACAPCQPFTKQRSIKNLHQRNLIGEFSRFVKEFNPGYVFIENVPGLARVGGFSSYRRFKKILRDLGHQFEEGILDAKEYGVPQTRRRLIFISSRINTIPIPQKINGPGLQPLVTVRDTILSLPPLNAGEVDPDIPNHYASNLEAINLERIKNTPPDGGDRRSWPASLTLECHRNGYNGHTDVYGRMWWDRPAPALTGRCDSLSNGRYGHPEQNRAISLREAARLQSFKDNYIFYGSSKNHIALQIGNAVPVKLAEVIGLQFLSNADR
ncbi:MAG: DNA cytosine methyltransferase [bacterium]|nr:DNA cytosine methyltransferase [bacterium]